MADLIVNAIIVVILWVGAIAVNTVAVAYERKLARPQREQRFAIFIILSFCVLIFVAIVASERSAVAVVGVLPFTALLFGVFRLAEANRWVRLQRELRAIRERNEVNAALFPAVGERVAQRGWLRTPLGPIYKSDMEADDEVAEDDERQTNEPPQ